MTDDDMTDPGTTAGWLAEDADDALDAARFDEQPFDDVRAVLADLPHLDAASVIDPALGGEAVMPDAVWERLSLAIATEASTRAAATHDNVVALPTLAATPGDAVTVPPAAATPLGRHSRASRWGGGLVAASVTLIAVGVGYTALHGTTPSPVAAGKARPAAAATLGSSSAPQAASAQAFSEQAPGPTAASLDAAAAAPSPGAPADGTGPSTTDIAESPQPLVQPRSTVVQAARQVMKSGTAYQHAQLPTQVAALLDSVGVQNASDIAAVPSASALPVDDGFTQTWASLRDCITWLTQQEDSQAIVVDRGTYEGDAAGVVVAPADPAAIPSATSPAPTMSLDTQAGRLDVWVVTPDCQHAASSVEDYLPMQLQP